jgi:lipoate-protein ligase A
MVSTAAPPTCLYDLAGRPGFRNMAIDQALLERARLGEWGLRLYRWAPHCLSFGRHEPARRRYDRARIEALGLDVVRRPTGGRAVWHADELTYALAVPADALGGLRESYREIHRMLLLALDRLGVPAELAPDGRPAPLDAGACFAAPAGGEIVAGGRKLVGSAQLREGAALLQHGSILLAGRQDLVRDLTLGGGPSDRSGSLAEATGHSPALREVADAVATAAAERWGGAWEPGPVSGDLLAEAARHEPTFRSPEWTWRA